MIHGDPCDVQVASSETIRLRRSEIDIPGKVQPYGEIASNTLQQPIDGKTDRVVDYGQNKYGRTIDDIYHNGTLINLTLVKAGLAWHYVKYTPHNTVLRKSEQQARKMNNGLWSSTHGSIPPWDWRKMSKDERDEYR